MFDLDRGRALARWALALALAAGLAVPAAAQEASPAPVQPAAPSSAASTLGAGDPTTPRGAMLQFLEAARASRYATAARYLDLSSLGPRLEQQGAELARRLKVVLDHKLLVDLDSLSAAPEGRVDDGLPPEQDVAGAIATSAGPVPILLERVPGPEGVPIWKIAGSTVAQVDKLYDEFGFARLEELLPRAWFRSSFLRLELWQWLGLGALVLAAHLMSLVFALFIGPIVERAVRRKDPGAKPVASRRVVGPIRLALALGLFHLGLIALRLPLGARAALGGVIKALVILAAGWLIFRLIDLAFQITRQRLIERGRIVATGILPLGRRTAKIFTGILVFLGLLQNLGFNVSSIVAGLGVGGLAVALAAQKTIENFFGGVSIVLDQPVRVGDSCRFGGQSGVVEDIGLRSTRIRTPERSVVTIPNASFSTMQIESLARQDRLLFDTVLRLRYETSTDQLRHLLIQLRELLIGHPKIHPDPARVRLTGLGESALEVELHAYVMTSDTGEFHAVREDLLMRIMDIVRASGTDFALPGQTLYFARDRGLDAERQQAAEAEVERLRAANALPLPQYPPEKLSELEHKLDYPPRGSALRDPS